MNITTKGIPVEKRIDFWRDLVCEKITELQVEPKTLDNNFFGEVNFKSMPSMQISTVSSTRQDASRTKSHISRVTEEIVLFCFQVSGSAKMVKGDSTETVFPGDFTICPNTQPFKWHFPEHHQQLVIRLSERKLLDRVPGLLNIPVTCFSGKIGLNRIIFQTITAIWEQYDNLQPETLFQMEGILVDLLATLLSEYYQAFSQHSRNHTVRIVEIKSLIRQHVRNPDLSVTFIADAMNLSSRYLHWLFKNENTSISQLIRDLRLKGCCRDLEDSSKAHLSISDILFSWGFSDSSHFSKIFKACYGISPREYRELKSDLNDRHRIQ